MKIMVGAKSVLENITASDITAYVDLKDKEVGEYELEVQVNGSNPLATYIPKKTKVKVKVTKSK